MLSKEMLNILSDTDIRKHERNLLMSKIKLHHKQRNAFYAVNRYLKKLLKKIPENHMTVDEIINLYEEDIESNLLLISNIELEVEQMKDALQESFSKQSIDKQIENEN